LRFQRVDILSPPSATLKGWYLPAEAESADRKSENRVLLYCQGFDGNMGDRVPKLRMFHELGLAVLIFDYRGYGESSGWPHEEGLYRDAFAAYFHLTEEKRISPKRIFLYGEGYGAALALEVASRSKAGGVILEGAPISSLHLLADYNQRIPWHRFPGDRFDSLSRIGAVGMPVLILHSEEDDVVPPFHGEHLFARAAQPKELVKVHGSHRTAYMSSFDVFHDKLKTFVERDSALPTEPAGLQMRSSASWSSPAQP
jgi:fermentation-respiration switch protein FrsA (DUF1100 family)